MPTVVNGHLLGVEHNGVFNSRNTDPIRPFGRLWVPAAAAWNDMRLFIAKEHGHWIAPAGPASSARKVGVPSDWPPPEFGTQWYFRGFWCAQGKCGNAAVPGTSNHGWGIAVDVHHTLDAFYIKKHGARFGWSHDEGARIGEWWHFRYIGGYRSPMLKLRADERRWVYLYRTLRMQGIEKAERKKLRWKMRHRASLISKRGHLGKWHRRYRRRILRRYGLGVRK